MNSYLSSTKDQFSNSYFLHVLKLGVTHPVLFNKIYEFKNKYANENTLYVYDENKLKFAFTLKRYSLKEINTYISFPKGFICQHYNKNKISKVGQVISNENCHLTYHGKTRKKKISGEIHISKNGKRIGKEAQNYLEAPLLTENDINTFPLPVCKFYFTKNMQSIETQKEIYNYIDVTNVPVQINSIDVYISKRSCFNRILQCRSKIDYLLGFIFYGSSLNMFAKGQLGWSYEIDNRLSSFIRVYRLPCNDLELLLIFSNDERVIHNNKLANYLIYFKTKNYLENILDRYVVENDGGFYIGVAKGPTPNYSNWKKLSDL